MLMISIMALAVVISGCGAQRQAEPTVQQTAVSRSDYDVICRTEMPTGSHLPQRRCYRRADEEQTREATRRALKAPP